MSIELVVARYNEDISWLNETDYPKYVYNKGVPLPDYYDEIKLKNIGRESHTYLYHIVNNYHKLDPSSVTVFTQGRFHDHTNLKKDVASKLIELGMAASESGIKALHRRIESTFDRTFRMANWYYKVNQSEYPFDEWFLKYISDTIPTKYEWAIAAILAVRNDLILSRPLEYYKNLLYNISDLQEINPESAHYFERSWLYVFNPEYTKTLP